MVQISGRHLRNIFVGSLISILLLVQAALHGRLSPNTGQYLEQVDEEANSTPSLDDLLLNLTGESLEIFRRERDISLTEPEENIITTTTDFPEYNPELLFSQISEELFLRNIYNGNFTLTNPSTCTKKSNITLLILITTAVDHFDLRNAVRTTWGHFSLRKDVTYAFVIGDSLFSNYNKSVIDKLNAEILLYGDFIVTNFEDTYRNLVLKTLYMLDWIVTHCPNAEYFLKTDDDVFVNVPRLLELIDTIREKDKEEPKIYGNVFGGHLPQRNSSHRHFVPYNVYPEEVRFPNFTSGPAYLMTTKIVKSLFELALDFPFVPLEDVLITGFVAASLNIPRIHLLPFHNEIQNPIVLQKCDLIRIYSGMTNGSQFQMYSIWHTYLDGKATCSSTNKKEKYKGFTQHVFLNK